MNAPTWWRRATAAVGAASAMAQAPAPTPSPTASPTVTPKRPVMVQASPRILFRGGLAVDAAEPQAVGPGKHDGSLAGVKALEIGDGRARLLLGGVERVVTPGTVIGTDTVKSITPGRIVLTRAAPDSDGGHAIVFVTFDEQGRTRVMVVASKNPTSRAPLEVKQGP